MLPTVWFEQTGATATESGPSPSPAPTTLQQVITNVSLQNLDGAITSYCYRCVLYTKGL